MNHEHHNSVWFNTALIDHYLRINTLNHTSNLRFRKQLALPISWILSFKHGHQIGTKNILTSSQCYLKPVAWLILACFFSSHVSAVKKNNRRGWSKQVHYIQVNCHRIRGFSILASRIITVEKKHLAENLSHPFLGHYYASPALVAHYWYRAHWNGRMADVHAHKYTVLCRGLRIWADDSAQDRNTPHQILTRDTTLNWFCDPNIPFP